MKKRKEENKKQKRRIRVRLASELRGGSKQHSFAVYLFVEDSSYFVLYFFYCHDC